MFIQYFINCYECKHINVGVCGLQVRILANCGVAEAGTVLGEQGLSDFIASLSKCCCVIDRE